VPATLQVLHRLLFGEREKVEEQAISVYRDVLRHLAHNPEKATPWALLNTRLRLIVTLAETGRLDQLAEHLDTLGENPEQAAIAQAVRFAYGLEGAGPFSAYLLTGIDRMPIGWASERLRLRTAERLGEPRAWNAGRQRLMDNGERWRTRTLLLVALVGAVLVVGAIVLLGQLRSGAGTPWRSAVLEAPWSLTEGVAVFVRAALAGLLILIVLGMLSGSYFRPGILGLWSSLFASLPMLWLLHQYLLRPRGVGFGEGFGLRGTRSGVPLALRIILAVLALEWAGTLLIAWLSWQLGLQGHWSEGLYERMIFGPWQTTLLGMIGLVVWAPIFEEIGFRGLVYVTLRSRMGPITAALVSALLFSALHLYSVPGFLSVFWSGLVLAWTFERFHSLLPGMVAHAAGNLLALSPVLLFYR